MNDDEDDRELYLGTALWKPIAATAFLVVVGAMIALGIFGVL